MNYNAHLRRQYRDRLRYWQIRAEARFQTRVLALICDGMDQAKFAYPRSPVMQGKQWANLARPRCHIVGIKVHGFGIFMVVSEADCPKDSNHHLELILRAITDVRNRFNLDTSRFHLHIQSDNCVREVKNNTIARACASMCSRGWGFSKRSDPHEKCIEIRFRMIPQHPIDLCIRPV